MLNFRLQPEAFETIRLLLVVLTVLLRFALMPIYLQSYLNIAHDRIEDLRTEAGRITNLEYQKKVSSRLIKNHKMCLTFFIHPPPE